MKFHNFENYAKRFSDYKVSFLGKIGLASGTRPKHHYFSHIGNEFDLLDSDVPVIISEDFNFKSSMVNESSRNRYNSASSPDINSVFSEFMDKSWIPKAVDSIQNVKSLKFPIVATSGHDRDLYKTLGKLRSAEKRYKKFIESPQPKTRFRVIAFRNEPICIEEKINRMPFDVSLNGFKHLNSFSNIAESIYGSYGLDVYNMELIESLDGNIYLNDVNKLLDLNPHQAYTVYNTVYQDYYNSKLPSWVKNRILDEDLSEYYKRKYFDSKLIKSNNSMDYSKYIKK